MRHMLSTLVGKTVLRLAKLRGGGSALPGLVVDKLDSNYLARILTRLPGGVVVVSGTNGKTSTTKMIVEMLEAQGLTVFSNKTGSNFSRGVIAAAVAEANTAGHLAADIAVLELDEAHAMHFINRVKPDYTVLLNVLRDQLDRFGELDTTARFLERIADATTGHLLVNGQDPLVNAIGDKIAKGGQATVHRFGVSRELERLFPSDEQLHDLIEVILEEDPATASDAAVAAAAATGDFETADQGAIDQTVTLVATRGNTAEFSLAGKRYAAELQLTGLYNQLNAAAALGIVKIITQQLGRKPADADLVKSLEQIKPAFGRGERLELDGSPLELVLVKNPAGFRLGLASYSNADTAVMIAINDQYADGRDMSWLWDVDYKALNGKPVALVSGTRAWDMAVRLDHDEVTVQQVEPDLAKGLKQFRETSRGQVKRIYCTYTAMLALRKILSEITDVEEVW